MSTELEEIRRTLSNLHPNTRYIVRVRAVNGFGVKSEWSEALDFVTGTDKTVPQSPSSLIASFDSLDLLLKWKAPRINVDSTVITDFSHYELTLMPNGILGAEEYIYNTTESVYVLMQQMQIAIWGESSSSVRVEIRAVDTAGNKSAPLERVVTA